MSEIKLRRSFEKEGFKMPVFEYRPDWPYISVGFGGEKDYFVENLSLLIASGMGISASLETVMRSLKTHKMKKALQYISDAVAAGSPLWRAFEATKIFPDRVISLIRSGEEAGRLPEHLNLVTLQMHKDKIFKSRLRSALLYPGIVLILATIVMVASTWYILPNLVAVFDASSGTLPIQTRILLEIGRFLHAYGYIAVPTFVAALITSFYLLFVNKKTKKVGDFFLMRIGGVNKLVQGIELSRFGYSFGALLQAGFPVSEALVSVRSGSDYSAYRNFYSHIEECIARGDTFRATLSSVKNSELYIPFPIQQLIIAAESSGRLPETLIRIGVIFEEKTEAMSRDLATVLEPVVLIVVGLLVAFIVTAIIGPIYGLSEQI